MATANTFIFVSLNRDPLDSTQERVIDLRREDLRYCTTIDDVMRVTWMRMGDTVSDPDTRESSVTSSAFRLLFRSGTIRASEVFVMVLTNGDAKTRIVNSINVTMEVGSTLRLRERAARLRVFCTPLNESRTVSVDLSQDTLYEVKRKTCETFLNDKVSPVLFECFDLCLTTRLCSNHDYGDIEHPANDSAAPCRIWAEDAYVKFFELIGTKWRYCYLRKRFNSPESLPKLLATQDIAENVNYTKMSLHETYVELERFFEHHNAVTKRDRARCLLTHVTVNELTNRSTRSTLKEAVVTPKYENVTSEKLFALVDFLTNVRLMDAKIFPDVKRDDDIPCTVSIQRDVLVVVDKTRRSLLRGRLVLRFPLTSIRDRNETASLLESNIILERFTPVSNAKNVVRLSGKYVTELRMQLRPKERLHRFSFALREDNHHVYESVIVENATSTGSKNDTVTAYEKKIYENVAPFDEELRAAIERAAVLLEKCNIRLPTAFYQLSSSAGCIDSLEKRYEIVKQTVLRTRNDEIIKRVVSIFKEIV